MPWNNLCLRHFLATLGVPLGLFGHSSTPHGYPDWLRQFRTNIVNHKAVRFLLKPSFYAMKQFLFGVVCWHIWVAPWVVWASPRRHGGTPCGYPDWLGQFRTNIATRKADRICLEPSFYAMKQSLFGAISCHIGGAPWVVRASQLPLGSIGVPPEVIQTDCNSLKPILLLQKLTGSD